jgi:hypothetical protein
MRAFFGLQFICSVIFLSLGFLEIYFSKQLIIFILNLRFGNRRKKYPDFFGRIGLIVQGLLFLYTGISGMIYFVKHFEN